MSCRKKDIVKEISLRKLSVRGVQFGIIKIKASSMEAKTQDMFNLVELGAFLHWRKLNKKDKEVFVKKLARWEADEIIKEINNKVKSYEFEQSNAYRESNS